MLLHFRNKENKDLCELVSGYSCSSFGLRTMAAVELGFRRLGECRSSLHDALRGTNIDVVAVAWALKVNGDDAGLNEFRQELRVSAINRSALAAERLGLLGDKSGLKGMLEIASQPMLWWYYPEPSELDSYVASNRMQVARALGAIRDGEAVPILIKLLEDSSDAVVETAATALVRIGDKAALEAMKETLDLADEDHRELPKLHLAYEILSAPSPVEGFLNTLERQSQAWAVDIRDFAAQAPSLYADALPMFLTGETIRRVSEAFVVCSDEVTDTLGELLCLTVDEAVWCESHLFCYTGDFPYNELEDLAVLLDELKGDLGETKANIADRALLKIRV